MKVSGLKKILNNIEEDLPIIFLTSENHMDNFYQLKDTISYEIHHVNVQDIDDERVYFREIDFEEFYSRMVNILGLDLTDDEIEELYEQQEWTKALVITLDD